MSDLSWMAQPLASTSATPLDPTSLAADSHSTASFNPSTNDSTTTLEENEEDEEECVICYEAQPGTWGMLGAFPSPLSPPFFSLTRLLAQILAPIPSATLASSLGVAKEGKGRSNSPSSTSKRGRNVPFVVKVSVSSCPRRAFCCSRFFPHT
jgi:hypothetical protein